MTKPDFVCSVSLPEFDVRDLDKQQLIALKVFLEMFLESSDDNDHMFDSSWLDSHANVCGEIQDRQRMSTH